MADSIAIYLYIFQERETCIRDGLQEGALQTAGKDSGSICSDGQTCCNVVQLNLSVSGLGGHSVKWIMGCEHLEVFILRVHGTFSFIGYCSSPTQKL
jgi:hypothetical protein